MRTIHTYIHTYMHTCIHTYVMRMYFLDTHVVDTHPIQTQAHNWYQARIFRSVLVRLQQGYM